MAAITASLAANIVKTTYDAEFGMDPFEESMVAKFVAEPVGSTAIGETLTLRKVSAVTGRKYTGNVAGGIPSSLTGHAPTEHAVTTTLAYAYAMAELDEPMLHRIVDDADYRNKLRKQMAAAVNGQIDIDLLMQAASFSHSESGAVVNETMYASALKQLAKYAMNKFKIGETDVRLFVHPDVLDDVLVMPLLKEYQIRGGAGSAVNGTLATGFGIKLEETGNVYQNLGHTYCPLILKDAWAIGYNRTPSALPDQKDGIVDRLIYRAHYGICEWFDSSGVVLDVA